MKPVSFWTFILRMSSLSKCQVGFPKLVKWAVWGRQIHSSQRVGKQVWTAKYTSYFLLATPGTSIYHYHHISSRKSMNLFPDAIFRIYFLQPQIAFLPWTFSPSFCFHLLPQFQCILPTPKFISNLCTSVNMLKSCTSPVLFTPCTNNGFTLFSHQQWQCISRVSLAWHSTIHIYINMINIKMYRYLYDYI